MSFRKSVRCGYVPPVNVSFFGEFRLKDSSATSSSIRQSVIFSDCESLSSEALPVVSLESLIKSNKVIDGSVSFGRTDPARIESDVHSVVSSYISSSSNLESHES